MKKKFITFAFFTLVTLAFFSCKQDISESMSSEATISIADAQSWYDSNKPQGVVLEFAKVKASTGKLNGKPDWKHAYKKDNSDFTTVQVPLSVQGAFYFVTPERKKAFEETGDKRYMESLTQMVVVKNKKTSKTIGFLMTIIPDKEYQEATNFKPFYSSYKKWQKGYSGLIFYHTLEGKFTNGWKFMNGKVTNSISPNEDSGIDLKLNVPAAQKSVATTVCYDYYSNVLSQYCTDWYTQSESYTSYNGTTCGNWFNESTYMYTICEESGGDGGYTGGTGNGNDPVTPSSTAKRITAKISLDDVGINQFNVQLIEVLKNCGFSSMYDYLTNSNTTFSDVYIDPSITGPGRYDSQTETLVFQDNFTIGNGIAEEFVHFFQNHYYSNGIGQYSNAGHANIEFEAKLVQDLECQVTNHGCSLFGCTSSNSVYYQEWILTVTKNGNAFPSYEDLLTRYPECGNMNYWDFLNAFSTNPEKPSYNSPVLTTLTPKLIDFIKNNNCN